MMIFQSILEKIGQSKINHRGHRVHRDMLFHLCVLCALCGFLSSALAALHN